MIFTRREDFLSKQTYTQQELREENAARIKQLQKTLRYLYVLFKQIVSVLYYAIVIVATIAWESFNSFRRNKQTEGWEALSKSWKTFKEKVVFQINEFWDKRRPFDKSFVLKVQMAVEAMALNALDPSVEQSERDSLAYNIGVLVWRCRYDQRKERLIKLTRQSQPDKVFNVKLGREHPDFRPGERSFQKMTAAALFRELSQNGESLFEIEIPDRILGIDISEDLILTTLELALATFTPEQLDSTFFDVAPSQDIHGLWPELPDWLDYLAGAANLIGQTDVGVTRVRLFQKEIEKKEGKYWIWSLPRYKLIHYISRAFYQSYFRRENTLFDTSSRTYGWSGIIAQLPTNELEGIPTPTQHSVTFYNAATESDLEQEFPNIVESDLKEEE